jgi:Beta-propeller repeat
VKYADVWPGIDLAYHGKERQLEYDFIVAPHANPSAIRLGFKGARKMRVDRHGDLVLRLAGGELRTHKPVAYQEVEGVKSIVTASYAIKAGNRVGFRLGAYDHAAALVIDPTVVYSTYLGGGNGIDNGQGIAVDATGAAYVTGNTASTNFPTTAGAFQTAHGGGFYDAFVTKLNPAGSGLVYSTYLGGSGDEYGQAIAVDAAGAAYVTGNTSSTNFPDHRGSLPDDPWGRFRFL